MSNDSSRDREKGLGLTAKLAGGHMAPVPPSDDSSLTRTSEQIKDELSPKSSVPSSKKVPWGPWAVVYAIFIFWFTQYVVIPTLAGVYIGLRGIKGEDLNTWASKISVQATFALLSYALIFTAIVWFVHWHKGNIRQLGLTRFRWIYIVWAICGYLVYFLFYICTYYFISKYVPSINLNQKQELGFEHLSSSFDLTLTFVSFVVLPPIVEETVFRGFIFGGIRTRLRFVWTAIITSLLFGALHLQLGSGNPPLWIAAIDTFMLSMVMCYVREKTDSIVPTILIHAIKNGVAFLALYIFVS